MASRWIYLPMVALAGCRAPAPLVDVVNLEEEIHCAEVRVEPVVIDLGTPEARPFLVSGWSHDEKRRGSGETFVWSLGQRSDLVFHLGWMRELTLSARCRPFRFRGARPQNLIVELNDRRVYAADLMWGDQTIVFALPADVVRTGDNRLAFIYGADRAPAEVIPGSRDERRLAIAWDEIEFSGPGIHPGRADSGRASTGGALTLEVGSRVDFFSVVPRGAELELGAIECVGDGAAVVALTLLEDLQDEAQIAVLQPSSRPTTIELHNRGGPARVRLEVVPGDPSPAHAVRLVNAVIKAPVPADAALTGGGSPEAAPDRPSRTAAPPNVVIYLVDALRADRLGCYGNTRGLSPRLDEFAGEAVVFDDAVAQSSWTKAAVASLFTGLWPADHGANGPDDGLPPDIEVLPELLRGAGYRTAAVSANAFVHRPFGFGRGFDDFVFLGEGNNDAASVNAAAFRLIDEMAPGPFFLYLHAIDPHAPYRPPPALRSRFADGVADPSVGEVETVRGLVLGRVEPSPGLTRDLEALYAAEVAANDVAFGELVDFLRQRGLYEDSVILFIADHGEAFGEHGSFTHGIDLYPEVVKIPLVLRLPGGELAGRRVSSPVQQTEVMATVLDLAGIAKSDAKAGATLFKDTHDPLPAVTYLDYWGRSGAAVVTGRWKLISPLSREFGSTIELYDRLADPGETVNLAEARPVIAGLLATELRRRLISRARGTVVEIDDQTRRDLEALGYIADGGREGPEGRKGATR